MRPRILIVENDVPLLQDYRRYVNNIGNDARKFLRVSNFEIIEACCANDARQKLIAAGKLNQPFDLLLLDLGLPNDPHSHDPGKPENGIAVLNCAHNQGSAKETVVVSALLNEPKNVIEAVRFGAADFVDKSDFKKEYLQEAVLRSLRRSIVRSSIRVFEQRIRSLVPCAEQGLVDGFGMYFSRCIQEVGRAEGAIRSELYERFGLDSEQDSTDILVQQLGRIDGSLQSGRNDWMRQQALLGLSSSRPKAESVSLAEAIAKLERTVEPCLTVKNATIKQQNVTGNVLSFDDDVFAVLNEMILGGLEQIDNEFPDTEQKIDLSTESKSNANWIDLVLHDSLATIDPESAQYINEGASIPPDNRFGRNWGLSVVQYVALRGGGRLTVAPQSPKGNIITYRIPRAQHA